MMNLSQLKVLSLELARGTYEAHLYALPKLYLGELQIIGMLAEDVVCSWSLPFVVRSAYLRLAGEIVWEFERRLSSGKDGQSCVE